MREYLLCLFVAASVTYLVTPLARRFALAWGAMAEVRDRDVHAVPIPYLGGLAMLGSENSFGLGGYYKTPVEEVLPLVSRFEKEKEKQIGWADVPGGMLKFCVMQKNGCSCGPEIMGPAIG